MTAALTRVDERELSIGKVDEGRVALADVDEGDTQGISGLLASDEQLLSREPQEAVH